MRIRKILSMLKSLFMNFENISASACKKIIEEEGDNVMLVDVRSSAEYAQGMIDGSINIPLDEITGRSNELSKEKKIILYCASGNRSGMACRLLQAQGFTELINMRGGIFAWKREGFDVK